MSGLPSWSESRRQVERFEERHGPLMGEHEAPSFVRGPQAAAMLRRAGIEIRKRRQMRCCGCARTSRRLPLRPTMRGAKRR